MNELYGWIGGAVALLAAIVGIFLKGRSTGKKSEQAKQAQIDLAAERKRNETNNTAKEVERSLGKLPDDTIRQQLRDKWTKDH